MLAAVENEGVDQSGGVASFDPLIGVASRSGTARYEYRMSALCHPRHFRGAPGGVRVSSLGMGTAGSGPQKALVDALAFGLTHGLNLIDTAANYRCGLAEAALGCALHRLSAEGQLRRDEVMIVSKGGYLLTNDGNEPNRYSIAPESLATQLRRTLSRLGVTALDAYLLHNPEEDLVVSGRKRFEDGIRRACFFLEGAYADGLIGGYGVATWDALRLSPDQDAHMGLCRLKELAAEAAGSADHFHFVQLPVSLVALEALLPVQRLRGQLVSTLVVAEELGLMVLGSAALGGPMRPAWASPGALAQFCRSLPGVTTALVGVGSIAHAADLASLCRESPLAPAEVARLVTQQRVESTFAEP